MRYIIAGLVLGAVAGFIISYEMGMAGLVFAELCFFGGILVCVGQQVREDEK